MEIIAFLVAIIVSCSVSRIPLAEYIAEPAVLSSSAKESAVELSSADASLPVRFLGLDVNLN